MEHVGEARLAKEVLKSIIIISRSRNWMINFAKFLS